MPNILIVEPCDALRAVLKQVVAVGYSKALEETKNRGLALLSYFLSSGLVSLSLWPKATRRTNYFRR
jgi:hypothetical protein